MSSLVLKAKKGRTGIILLARRPVPVAQFSNPPREITGSCGNNSILNNLFHQAPTSLV
jgi:hypothetical protein